MSYEIIRSPFMLFETVSMLYYYVNKIDLRNGLNRGKLAKGNPVTEEINRRAGWIQEIIFKVCKGLNMADPTVQRYFSQVEGETCDACLAYYMTALINMTLLHSDYWENVEEVKTRWREVREQGLRIDPQSTGTIHFIPDPEGTTDLFDQVKALNLPPEFRLELYDVLRDFENKLTELAKWMEPYARHLEECLREVPWLWEEVLAHCEGEFAKVAPLDFVASSIGKARVECAAEHTLVGVSLIAANTIAFGISDADDGKNHNVLLVGSSFVVNGVLTMRLRDLDHLGAGMKCFSDRKRLSILQLLSKEPGYGLELAERLGMDSGNMFRTLAQLHQYGFLQQEREGMKNYYRADRKAVHDFFQQVEATIFESET